MKVRAFSSALLIGACVWLSAGPAEAQLSRVGETFAVSNGVVRGSAVAHDTVNNVYLTVGAHGGMLARFVSADGAVLGDQFAIPAVFAQFPHVAYSPDAGAFLVTWHDQARVWVQLVRYPSGVASAAVPVSPGDFVYEVMGAPVAYSTTAREFLVVWRNYDTFDILGIRVGNNGQPIGTAFSVSQTASQPEPFFRSNPSIGYSPTSNEFVVVYSAGYPVGGAYARRVQAGSSQLLGAPILLGQSVAINVTGVTYMPASGHILAAWHQDPPNAVYGRVINANGTLNGNAIPLSARFGTYDSLGLDANDVSGTVLLVGHDKLSPEDGGVEILTTGNPANTGAVLTGAGGNGNFHPKPAGHNARREWMLVASNQFARTISQRIASATGSSGPPTGGGNPPPPPPPPACTYSINDNSATAPGTTFIGALALSTQSGCAWTASSNVSWLGVFPSSGTGSRILQWNVLTNSSGNARTGTITVAGRTLTVNQVALVSRYADFNFDSFVDMIWQNQATGLLSVWRMNGFNLMAGEYLSPAVVSDTGWKIVGTPDLDRNGTTDLLWQHDSGYLSVWRMQGETQASGHLITQTPLADTGWRVVGTGDLDGDGWTDILWQHTDGRVSAWFMQGTTIRRGEVISQPVADRSWRIAGVGDINGDNHVDVVWHHGVTGQVAVWVMNRTQVVDGVMLNESAPDTNWRIRALGDFDRDGDLDFIWHHASTGALAAWIMNRMTVQHGFLLDRVVPDTSWKVVGPK